MYQIKKSAESMYQALVRQLPEVQSLFVTQYKIPPKYEDRVTMGTQTKQLLAQALNLRNKIGMPFWDAVITKAMAIGPINETILDGALYHQHIDKNVHEIPRSDVLSTGIVASVENTDIMYPWAVLSEVRTKHGKKCHFPMLDFRCEVSEPNLISLQRVAHRLLKCPWAIIESNTSYHLIVASLIDYKEFVSFLGAASLLGPLVDRSYIAHQLINGIAGLRIVRPHKEPDLIAKCTTFPRDSWGI